MVPGPDGLSDVHRSTEASEIINASTDNNFSVGLTGGIASGKTTVAELFADLGVPVIDTDVIARTVVEPGSAALAEIREAFGPEMLLEDGSLDRGAMRSRVFSDAAARRQLEAITHPRIRAVTLERAAAAGGDYQLIVVPLLVESTLRDSMDRILVVDCDEQVQMARLMARDAETEDQARRMIAAQSSRSERLAIADDVVQNDGDLDDTREQVEALHARYLQLAQ